jgi:NH3-dependent NAD+ synthetase
VIPEEVLTRAPTAELRENQTDQDTLPPYEVLDTILERLVEREEPIAKIVAPALADKVYELLGHARAKLATTGFPRLPHMMTEIMSALTNATGSRTAWPVDDLLLAFQCVQPPKERPR